jgi:hypothetical protein
MKKRIVLKFGTGILTTDASNSHGSLRRLPRSSMPGIRSS